MMKTLLFLLSLLLALPAMADTLYFEEVTPEETLRISLTFEEDKVYGMQIWELREAHGSRGSLQGNAEDDGLLRLKHEYTIEGSDQTEEVLYKLEGDQLLIGEGELEESDGGILKLKDPGQVKFTKALQRVKVDEPKPGSPERKAMMDTMRGPISAYVGKTVEFTGDIRAYEGWACFSGNVATTDGKEPASENAAFALSLDFLALLKKDPEGKWQLLYWGFAGDIGARDEALGKFPEVPWVVLD